VRSVWDREVGGSNPLAPTRKAHKLSNRATHKGGFSHFVTWIVTEPRGSGLGFQREELVNYHWLDLVVFESASSLSFQNWKLVALVPGRPTVWVQLQMKLKALLFSSILSLVSIHVSAPAVCTQTPIDSDRAKKAEVVLRVRLISQGEGSKYLWDRVEVVKVLKNKARYAFGKHLAVAHYSWKPGIPDGTCTIYLERYNTRRKDLWKLLSGSADEGVSHGSPE
jgi:hypothetical protein